MWKFNTKKIEKEITVEGCIINLKKQIAVLILVGFVLIIIDLIAATLNGGIHFTSKDGNLYMRRPAAGSSTESGEVKATVTTENGEIVKKYTLRLEPQDSQKSDGDLSEEAEQELSPEDAALMELSNMVSSLNDDVSGKYVALPSHLSSGENINWSVENSRNTPIIFLGMILMLFLLIKNRFSPLQKLKKERRESITRQLPEFVNRIVLLLNAGLILNTAFQRSVEDSLRYKENEDDYFSRTMKNIYVTMCHTNGSFNREFREFAKTSGSTDVMRISNIINDNISKGVELTDKLCCESEVLWLNRKKNCEERGRIAETKLTLPLTVFLMVLIVITVSPALLQL